MNSAREGGFEPAPRPSRTTRHGHHAQNLRDELLRILGRTEFVIETGHVGFTDGAAHYDVANMVIIRLAALLERPDSAVAVQQLTPEEVTAIRATRNIAAHAGYVGMNDELFWTAVTVRVPDIIRRLLDGIP